MTTAPITDVRIDRSVSALRQAISDHLTYSRGTAVQSASPHDVYVSLCYAIRDHLMDRWRRTAKAYYGANPKFVYYLSAEYLLGRQLPNNLLYTDLEEVARQALAELDIDFEGWFISPEQLGLHFSHEANW